MNSVLCQVKHYHYLKYLSSQNLYRFVYSCLFVNFYLDNIEENSGTVYCLSQTRILLKNKAWFKTIANESKGQISIGRSYLG